MKRNKLGQIIKYNINEKFFIKKTNSLFWLIGILAADGCIRNNHISISQSNLHGLKLIKHIKKLIEFNGKIYNYKNSYSIQFTSNKVIKILNKYNIVQNKTLIYSLPNFKNKKEFKSFIRGYFDGDGSVGFYTNGTKTVSLCANFVGTKQFISKVKKQLPLGYSVTHIKRAKNLYELRWYGKNAINFLNWLYEDKMLYKYYKEKKFEQYFKIHGNKYV